MHQFGSESCEYKWIGGESEQDITGSLHNLKNMPPRRNLVPPATPVASKIKELVIKWFFSFFFFKLFKIFSFSEHKHKFSLEAKASD